MARPSLRGLAALIIGSAALVTTSVVDRAPDSLATGTFVQSAFAQGGCNRPSLGTEDAILRAAENFMILSYVDIFGYARVQRVEGDWARVTNVPRVQVDHAILILRRDRTGSWQVVAGPGTSIMPEDVPGAPRAIFDDCPQA